jgi:hypothetical protein
VVRLRWLNPAHPAGPPQAADVSAGGVHSGAWPRPWSLLAAAAVMELGWLLVGGASPRLTESDGFSAAMFAQLQPLWAWADALRHASTPESVAKLVFVGGLVLACVGYVAALVVLARWPMGSGTGWIVAGMLVFGLTLLLMPGLLSTDLVMYAVYGRVAGVFGLNPYLMAPSSIGTDPLLAWASRTPEYATYATPYGPLWSGLSAALGATLASQPPLAQTFAYRLLGSVAYAATSLLVWQLAAPGQGVTAGVTARRVTLLLYAWNPLILFELIAGGHNEGLMLCLVLAGLVDAASPRMHWSVATGLVWAGALVKWVPALVLVFLATAQLRQLDRGRPRVVRLAGIVAVVLGVTLVLFGPWLDPRGPAALQANLTSGGQRYVNALLDLPTAWLGSRLLDRSGSDVVGTQAAVRGLTFLLARLCVLAYLMFEVRLVWRGGGQLRGVLESSARTLLVGLLVAATQVLAWYVVWPLTLAAPLGARNKVAQVAVAYSVLYLPTFYAIHEDMLPTLFVPVLLLTVALTPPLAVFLLGRARPAQQLIASASERAVA